MILGIIGTAGRGTDGAQISLDKWNEMKIIAGKFIKERNIDALISGGAAYADHIAVQAFVRGFVKKLYLELPCPFNTEEDLFHYEVGGPGPISNLYHQKFHHNLGVNSLSEIRQAIAAGAIVEVGGGFKDRNTVIAQKSDILLAYTFGDGPKLKPGGTHHCMSEFLKIKDKSRSWHVNLKEMKIYNGAEL